jgi:hypothetical protein
MIPTQITDYSQFDQPPYLLQQFLESDVESFLSLFNEQFEAIEAAAYTFINGFSIDLAYGNMLDVWGLRLGLPRSGYTDATYRQLLQVQAYINNSRGNAEKVILAVKTLFGATEVHYIPDPPAKIQVEQDGAADLFIYNNLVTEVPDNIVTNTGDQIVLTEVNKAEQIIFQEIAPAGVGLEIVYI